MADKKKMSVDDILAACRNDDGGGGGTADKSGSPEAETQGGAPSKEQAAAETPAEAAPKAGASAAGKKPSQMSVEEMLAAARGEKAGGAKSAAKAEPSADKPKPAAASAGKKPAQMSVEEMLAAARGEKAGGAKPAAKTPAAKPAAKAKPAAGAAAKPAAAKAAGPKDTASVLAAARKAVKPGPISTTEAAARGQAPTAGKPAKPKLEVPPMPERPAYARPAPPPAQEDETRRGFLATAIAVVVASPLAVGFTSLAVTHLLWLFGFARFMFPNILTEPPTRFKVGFPDELAPGQVETKFKAQFGVWIVRYEYQGQPQVFALKSVCTHLGCTPNWLEGEQKFKCPCHGSGFYKDGVNFEGPAPRPLERYAIRLADDGQLEVDKSRKFNEELGQWNDAASFVPV